jgi:8-oxo-dGTP diphosphatase
MAGLAAIALIRDAGGRILLVRQRGGPFAGAWLLPGGRAGDDESAVHALAREVREETGLTLEDAAYLTGYRTSAAGTELSVLLYRATARGTPAAEPGSAVCWSLPDAVPDAHPVLRRELYDALGIGDPDAIARDLAAAGITLEPLDPPA